MTTTFAIRAAVSADAAALALAGAATFLETFADSIPGPDLMAHVTRRHAEHLYAHWLADPAMRCWLAEAPLGAPVGYAVLGPPDLPTEHVGAGDVELMRIYTLGITRGTGTGAALMQAVLAEAAQMGAPRVLLGVYGENRRAIAFYRRMGFTEIGTRVFTVGGQRYDDLVFARAV